MYHATVPLIQLKCASDAALLHAEKYRYTLGCLQKAGSASASLKLGKSRKQGSKKFKMADNTFYA